MTNIWHEHGFAWMAEVSDAEGARLRRISSRQSCARGAIVFEPAARPRSVYLLEEGLVRIFRLSAQGAEATLGYVRPGEVFGELEVFSDRPRESFARAVSPSAVWRIPLAELRRLLDVHPRMARSVIAQIGNRFKRIESRFESLVLRSLRARIGFALLELAEDFGRAEADGLCIDLPLSQRDVGTLVGATRQSVNACLRELHDARLVVRRNGRFVVPDAMALRAVLSD